MFKQGAVFLLAAVLLMLTTNSNVAQERIPPEEQIRIRRVIGLGSRARATTPVYQSSVGAGVQRPRDWHVISIIYDSAPEWLDDLQVRFYVLSMRQDRETRQNLYSLFQQTVRYGDIERGRDRRAMAFLRPAALRRFGDVVAWAAVVSIDGTVVAEPGEVERAVTLPETWWRSPLVLDNPALTIRDGYLLDRSETPWAFINPDDYEHIR